MRKQVWTLCVDDYAPGITRLTFPLMRLHAERIGATFHVIRERKFPDWPVPYEKLQLHELSRGNDWTMYFDADTLIHPEMIDVTNYISKEVCCNNGMDFAPVRWAPYDRYFLRDGRNIGTCGWCIIASDWTRDIWTPLDEREMTREEAIRHCWPTVGEANCGLVDRPHLLDDFVMSRNVAKFGLKYATLGELWKKIVPNECGFLWHKYTIPEEQKRVEMQEMLDVVWKVPKSLMFEYQSEDEKLVTIAERRATTTVS